MSAQHDIIRAWCASCGMPKPTNGQCIALVAALSPLSFEAVEFIVNEWKENGEWNADGAMHRIADIVGSDA